MARKIHYQNLYVYMNGMRVGTLKRESGGTLVFAYDNDWLTWEGTRPISLSMPLTEIPYKGHVVNSYFDNLLPDSDMIRKRIQARFSVPSDQCFDLLSYIGADCIGALQLLTQSKVAILASIVQAEQTVHADERPTIAGLYINRLNDGMLLQSDPTVTYGIGDFTIRRVLNKHLQKDSPYNTYMYKGLPPGPINLPEISSIDAVLNYKKHKYIYMCAKPGYAGYHNFAVDNAGHEKNARAYRQWLDKEGIH